MSAEIGVNQAATESALLRAAGMRSGIAATFNYALSHTEYLRAGWGWQQYASQAGNDVGRGRFLSVEAGTHLRIEYPNLTLRSYISDARFSPGARLDEQLARLLPIGANRGLPDDDTLVGLSVSVGTVADGRYTRAWRPFGDIGLSYSDQSGRGLNITGGIAGSVFGPDTLQLRFTRSAGTPASPHGYREIGVNYLWLF